MSDASIIFYLLALVLPLTALASRRLPGRTVLKFALAWIGIFAVGFLLVKSFT